MDLRRYALLLLAGVPLAALAPAACRRAPKAPAGPTVKIYVDGALVREAPVGETPVALASLLPDHAADPRSWRRLGAHARGGRFLDVRRPAETYAGAEARLYLQKGSAAVGLFRPVREDLPPAIRNIARQPALALPSVTEIHVRITEPPPPPPPEEGPGVFVPLEVAGRGGEPLTEEEAAGLEESTGPKPQARGWALADVVRLRVPPREVASVVVTSADGRASETIDTALLLGGRDTLLLKRNQKNELVFQHWRPDGAKTEVRPVGAIRVELAKPGKDPG